MGSFFSTFVRHKLDSLSTFFWNKPCRVLITGLDAAGKTTLLYQIKLGEVVTTIPTIGFNVETFVYKNVEFTASDMGGQSRQRELWEHYTTGVNAVIFVVDAADRERINEAAEELRRLFESADLRDTKLLVYANKQDVSGSMSTDEVREQLNLAAVTTSPQRTVVGASATTGAGVRDGLEWLSEAILSSRRASE